MTVIEARGLCLAFGADEARVEALRGLNLEVREGEFVAVMGPSGSGKSSLLHALGGIVPPTAGSVRLGGADLAGLDDDALTLLRRRRVGFVFQFFNLLPTLSALENVCLPLVVDGVGPAEADARAREMLGRMGLAARLRHLPAHLSGGEQQRVAIARALVIRPVVLLADEPTGNLDSASSDQVMSLLRGLVDDSRQTTVMVTHDPRVAAMADRLIRLRDGQLVDDQALPPRRALAEIRGEEGRP